MRFLVFALGIWGASCALVTDPLSAVAAWEDCNGGLTYCEGRCVDTTSDPTNCSGCGRICNRGAACQDSFCGGRPDSGTDSGTDSGQDSGLDSGQDSGADSGQDSGPDSGQDSGLDAGLDSGPEDDAGPDAGSEDAGPDSGPVCPDPRCADCSVEQAYASGMVGCDGGETQCAAGRLCGAGLHLCTFVEYRAMGGSEEAASSTRWLASCDRRVCDARPDLDIIGPSNDVCGDCSGETGDARAVSWVCGGGAEPGLRDCAIGNFADATSRHIVSDALECLYAGATGTSAVMGAVCCPD